MLARGVERGAPTRQGTPFYCGRADVPALQLGQPLEHRRVPEAEAACECG